MTDSILKDIRNGAGLDEEDNSFDGELMIYINQALVTLNQNGIGNPVIVKDETTTWDEFKNVLQTEANKVFELCKLYVLLKTKLIFDPPPPNTARYMQRSIDETLWRLKLEYDLLERR